MVEKIVKKCQLWRTIFVALSFAAFVCVIVPMQTYLGSRELFEFPLAAVLAESAPIFAKVFLLSCAGIFLTSLLFGGLPRVIVTAFLLCEYLEVGLFSIGLPPLDGALLAFDDLFRAYINTGLWLLVGGVFIGCFHWLKSSCHWVALSVLVLGVASLVDARKPVDEMAVSPLAAGFCPRWDVVKSVRFSPRRNVIVLILDSTSAKIASDIMRKRPDLQKRLPGFVAYDNNYAQHEMTIRGLPALMTGEFLQKDDDSSDFVNTMFGEKSLLMPYVNATNAVYFSDELLSYGYTNRRLGDFTQIADGLVRTGPVFKRNSNSVPYVTLGDVVRFRLVPYKWKFQQLLRAYQSAVQNRTGNGVDDESVVYPLLASAPLVLDEDATLAVIHTSGIHSPMTRDRMGQHLETPTDDLDAHYEYGEFLFEQVAGLMDGLKKSGVYDRSYVVICADHGLFLLYRRPRGVESSILWTKPVGAMMPFSFSALPTSNEKIAKLVKALAVRDVSQDETNALLYTKTRRYLARLGSTWYTFGRMPYFFEWQYDERGNVMSCENRGMFKSY